MTGLDKIPFGEAVMALGTSFHREVDKPLAAAFWMACSDLPLADVLEAARYYIRSGGKFMPTPSELRERANRKSRARETQALLASYERYALARDASLAEWQALPPLRERMRDAWLSLPAMQEPKEAGK